MNTKFYGTGVALVTPFQEDLSVDFPALERLLEHTISGGVDYLVVMGTTGESATVTKAERKEILNFVREYNAGRLPIVYGIGGNNTASLLDTIQETDFKDVDAILSVSPYYNKPTQRGIMAHYETVANASPVPVILYNVPGRTASNLTAASTLVLAQHKNIIGVKEASGDMSQGIEIARDKPADFLFLAGDDMLTVPMTTFGAKGVISVIANALPQLFTRMVNESLTGNYTQAMPYLFQLSRINDLMYEEGNPVGVKSALKSLGICEDQVRLPLVSASDSLTARIKQTLASMQLPEFA
ncbi:4-hydroxy-tetrahydrodipicolinate synthase [Cytophagaceae bacterium DM2B3-1]|uniref:4-hydroxy-tetrahydrodipicolinate synthase n=1 Tax=Xanthocytophaga flava TaxID=3048013 RepID=A0ABT7CVB5_9BACT|nr:4-hydroxy-tetrahydrodipicolinate synthase [Xanthocytophaga flavus]MDJ1473262.1 4-hydroxy-tetrahydrodipicolinate synthase [Xanthocytophaga flavus]MDJ1497682.1 4-hydroxy-tetrahydrodipicolinate synthase [Xanthocytophaga flavus]